MVHRNAISSFGALAWMSLLSMLSMPIYIKLLGAEKWGLAAACASLQILSNFMDAGFSQILPRLYAQESDNQRRLIQNVKLLGRIYMGLGLLVFFILQATASYLANHWFIAPKEYKAILELAIRIVSFQLFFQFLNNLYVGLWNGLQHQVLANIRVCGFGTLKHAVALSALIFIGSEIWVYALAFALVALIEVVANRRTANQMLGAIATNTSGADKLEIKPLLKEVSLLSGGIILGLLVSQMDRIILSRTVDVENFGIYTVLIALAFAFLQLQTPINRAYFPVLVRDFKIDGRLSVRQIRKVFIALMICSVLPILVACLFAPLILELWLVDPRFVNLGSTTLRVLLFSMALNCAYCCIYQIIIVVGQSAIVLWFNWVALIVSALAIAFSPGTMGIMLGGIIWLCNTFTQLTLGLVWVYRQRHFIFKS